MSVNSKMTAIADAIRAKTGGSSRLTLDLMASEIASISTGGSLPSCISKVDGGSFTLASDTGSDVWLNHNLGETPKGFTIWSSDTNTYETGATSYVQSAHGRIDNMQYNSTETVLGYVRIVYRVANGTGDYNYTVDEKSSVSTLATSTQFRANRSIIKYKAGATYKWLAWA